MKGIHGLVTLKIPEIEKACPKELKIAKFEAPGVGHIYDSLNFVKIESLWKQLLESQT